MQLFLHCYVTLPMTPSAPCCQQQFLHAMPLAPMPCRHYNISKLTHNHRKYNDTG